MWRGPVIGQIDLLALGVGIAAAGALAALLWGIKRFHMPRWQDAKQRVDRSLPSRPLQALNDVASIRGKDPVTQALWRRHQHQMQALANQALSVPPDLTLMKADPFGLRLCALLVFLVSLSFGSSSNFAARFAPPLPLNLKTVEVQSWEGWVTQPPYSGLPSLYLPDLFEQADLRLLNTSRVDLRFYGPEGSYQINQTVSPTPAATSAADGLQQSFTVLQEGVLEISGPSSAVWSVTLLPDKPPNLQWNGTFEPDFFGVSRFSYAAQDDFGITAVRALIEVDLEALDRRYGLALDPESDAALRVDLPMPLDGRYRDFSMDVTEDFSKHMLSNLPVTVSLEAKDALGQSVVTPARAMTLPGRRFFDPLAAALIEQRRDLMWHRENAGRVERMLKAILFEPGSQIRKEGDYLQLRFISAELTKALAQGALKQARVEIADLLWALAIDLEDGDVDDALERMRQAEERLSQAMKNGASEAEIAELMQELREANENYLRQLMQQAEREKTAPEKGPRSTTPQNSVDLTQNDLQAMMDRIEKLMREGRMAEAQQALQELQQMMQNMQIAEGSSGEGAPREQALQGLEDTLRGQQNLSDEAFRNLQQAPSQSRGEGLGQQSLGETGPSEDATPPSAQDLADRQRRLREALGRQRQNLPLDPSGEGSDGPTARALDEAEEAMRRAERALDENDLPEAMDQQADALDALRDGIQHLDQAFTEAQRLNEADQGSAAQGRGRGEATDPLGRQQGRHAGDDGMSEAQERRAMERQAQQLLEEIRRRMGERDRSKPERDYLERLLEKF